MFNIFICVFDSAVQVAFLYVIDYNWDELRDVLFDRPARRANKLKINFQASDTDRWRMET